MPDSFDSIDQPSPSLNQRTAGHDDTLVEGPSADADGGAVAAAFYGVKPLNVSFAKAAAIESAANFLQRTADGAIFTNQSNGPNGTTPSKEKDETDPESIFMNAIERMEREREIWARTESAFAGVTLTGKQWTKMSDDLSSNSELRRWFIDQQKTKGMTNDDAEQYADRLARLMKIQAKPDGERSEAERQELDVANDNPIVRQDIEAIEHKEQELGRLQNDSAANINSSDLVTKSAARASEWLDLSTAPKLTDEYRAAAQNQAPTTKATPQRPLEVAQAAKMSGLDF